MQEIDSLREIEEKKEESPDEIFAQLGVSKPVKGEEFDFLQMFEGSKGQVKAASPIA